MVCLDAKTQCQQNILKTRALNVFMTFIIERIAAKRPGNLRVDKPGLNSGVQWIGNFGNL